ncbi:hypothetical protein J2S40_004129 [Nocardioides luteus]|uniref:DoxX family protein n=1 Tax=Nocardioides luteus TaxID=1844 RepID=A0ABQ5SPQ2_9ACTN|nr:hypothetical protein [Nocardioides luteus]MDR7313071.1 hypothetical protein [Nocardioides luteus]GGR44316.1 hypothetical protein GCM10010197_07290 [Nocardioides luteus]GLJ66132.1 hypothetical protein GCM10017579_01680 [Nocardioides luteus]
MTTQTGVRRPRISLFCFRAVAALTALFAIGQPIFIGSYFAGTFEALGLHSAGAVFLQGLSLLILAASVAVVVMRGRWWFLTGSVALFLLIHTQATLGYVRALQWHVPIGVVTVAVAVGLAIASFRRGAGSPREGRR